MNNKRKIISWALYDLANTIFATNVVSLYFPLWVIIQKNAPDKFYILGYYVSMLLAAFILPFFGILSDTLKKHNLFLTVFTLGCIFSTAFIGMSDSLVRGVILFCFANLFNQTAGNVFYPALLPQICSQDKIARVSGLGVALGYIGTLIALLTARLFIRQSNYNVIFIPTALLFLLFSLPCFIFVRSDEEKTNSLKKIKVVAKEEIRKLIKTLEAIKSNKTALKFFFVIMLAINGVNGVLLNMGVYGKKVIGFLDTELTIFVAISTVFAFIGSLIFGFIAEKLGPKRTLSFVLLGWTVALVATALATQKVFFWAIGPVIGALLAGTWVSSRPFIIQLAPKHRMGEFFGFTGLASISGALLSPPIWLFIITILKPFELVRYRVAVGALAVMIFTGYIILRQVPERRLID